MFRNRIGPKLSLCFTLVVSVAALSQQPAQAKLNSELEAQVESYIKTLRSQGRIRPTERTAWSVFDFKSGEKLVSINEGQPLQAASMIKPFLALAFFHQVKEGKIVYGPKSKQNLELMIQKSNNDTTNWCMHQVGGPAGAQAILNKHYPELSRNISIVEYIPKGGRTYKNKGSASDYSRFLYALWKNQMPYAEEIRRIMALPGSDRLYTKARRVPTGTMVYNKTGSTAMCCGDMGILLAKGKDGKQYAYTVIGIIESQVRNNSTYGTWISNRANVIREVSNIVYTSMKKRWNL